MAKVDAKWVGATDAGEASTYVLTPRDAPYLVSIEGNLVYVRVESGGTSSAGTPTGPVAKQAPARRTKPILPKPKAIR